MKKILMIMMMLLVIGCTTTKTEIVYKNVYPNLPLIEQPNVLTLHACKFSFPKNDDSIFIGFDKENYKCYLKNQEINREQKLLYQKVIDEMNQERIKWKELNKNS